MKNEGFALLAAIVIMVVCGALGSFSVSMLSTDTNIAQDTLEATQAFYIAEGGVQYAMKQLSEDTDWSNNQDILNKNFADGTFSIEYLAQDTNSATIRVTGAKDGISRKLTIGLSMVVGVPEAFSYVLYTNGEIKTGDAEDLEITGEQEESGSNLPTVDFPYYQSIASAGQDISGNYTFSSGTYSGIWYIDGNVTIRSDVTINGTVITTGKIQAADEEDITINPDSPYPALVANDHIHFQDSEEVTINGLVYAGADGSGQFKAQDSEDLNLTGLIIAADYIKLQDSEDATITYDESILTDPPTGFSDSGGSGGSGGTVTLDSWEETF